MVAAQPSGVKVVGSATFSGGSKSRRLDVAPSSGSDGFETAPSSSNVVGALTISSAMRSAHPRQTSVPNQHTQNIPALESSAISRSSINSVSPPIPKSLNPMTAETPAITRFALAASRAEFVSSAFHPRSACWVSTPKSRSAGLSLTVLPSGFCADCSDMVRAYLRTIPGHQ